MSGFIIGQKETKMKATGKRVDVPDYDVCRLSYYLKCGTVSCGVDIIVDELLDFRRAHKLPQDRQDAIFKLAATDFGLKTLANTTIFLVEEGNQYLPRNMNNEFYEVEQVSSLLAVQREAVIGGKSTQVRKIMVCNETWLKKFYSDPLKRNEARLRRICPQPSVEQQLLSGLVDLFQALEVEHNHCSHCKGSAALCACEHGCPRKAQSECKIVHSTVTCDSCKMQGIEGPRYKCRVCFDYDLCEGCYSSGQHEKTHAFDKIERVGCEPCPLPPRKLSVRTSHCSHCEGSKGKCTCTNGCLAKSNSDCTVVHKASCKVCYAQGIQGPRYKCKECWDIDLCEKCYNKGEHIKTHAFTRFARVGSQPVHLPPRQEPVSPSAPSEPPTTTSATSSPSSPPPSYPANPFIKSPDGTTSDVPIATAVPVTPDRANFQIGQTVRLVGTTSDHQNGLEGIVVNRFGDCLVVHLPAEDKKITVKPENLEAVSPAPVAGTLVELKGLDDTSLNGTLAVVTNVDDNTTRVASGRVPVRLLDNENRVLSIKLENLDVIEQVR